MLKGSTSELDAERTRKDPGNKQTKTQSRYWTAEEHKQFLIGLERFGSRDVKAIAQLVGTRNATQVRTHAQKYFLRVTREGQGKSENDPEEDDGDQDASEMMGKRHCDSLDDVFEKAPKKQSTIEQ